MYRPSAVAHRDFVTSSIMLFLLGVGLGLPVASVRAETVSPVAVVDALENSFGIHPGQRRNHTKGTCAAGEFVGTQEAARYSRSPLFSGEPVPVVARFSLAGGNPGVADTARNARGMALEFRLAEGQRQHMTMLNTPVFGAASPASFLAMVESLRPDPATGKPDPVRVAAFQASHPDNRAQADYLARNNPPRAYFQSAYWGIHTFRFVDAGDRVSLVRWQFVPEDGEAPLAEAELTRSDQNFLESGLIERVQRGPVRWRMVVTLGEAGDTETDPTVSWPAGRRQFVAGTLSLRQAQAQAGAPCEAINFDPLTMTDGIAATDDPILQFRSPAYGASFAKRLGGL